jgi:predicted nuclease of predicted toxin-antitoxin system
VKFKLDENFGKSIKEIFIKYKYDAETVIDENLQGSTDKTIYETRLKEKRCLVTLDLDFSDVLRCPPENSFGIVVLRASAHLTLNIIEHLILQFFNALSDTGNLDGELWIVEPNRIRIHNPQ